MQQTYWPRPWADWTPQHISYVAWYKKLSRVENFCAYITTTSYKSWFKELCILFFKNEIELKQHSSSTIPKTWIITTSANLTYFENGWHNNYDALKQQLWCIDDISNSIKGFIMVGLILYLIIHAFDKNSTSSMKLMHGWIILDLQVHKQFIQRLTFQHWMTMCKNMEQGFQLTHFPICFTTT
jgi:hypothetical protein